LSASYKKIGEYILLSFFSGLLITKGIMPAWHSVHSDFANYYVSAKLVADGVDLQNIYDNDWFQNKIKSYDINTPGKFSPFPPLTAWLLLPIASFEPLTAQRVFTLVNILFIAVGVVMLKKNTNWSLIQCATLLLGCGLGLVNNIAFGQVYLIMTVFILIALFLIKAKHSLIAGIILGVFTALKYFPIVIVAGLILTRARDVKNMFNLKEFFKNSYSLTSFYSIVILVLALLAQYVFFGSKIMSDFFQSALLPHLNGELSGQGLYSFQFQSWDVFFRSLFVYDSVFNPTPFLDWPNGHLIMKSMVTIIVFTLLSITLHKYRKVPLHKEIYLALPILAALVLLPVSATYHFILSVPAIAILASSPLYSKRETCLLLTLYGLLGLIPYGLAFNLGQSWGLFFAYPRLWLVSALFLIATIPLLRKPGKDLATYA